MPDVNSADAFFGHRSRLGGSERLWRDFRSYRDLWARRLAPNGVRPVPLWYMVEHGWHHAEMLYASLPRWVEVLEANLPGSRALIENPAEWFVLAASAYLHDCGMCMPAAQVREFVCAVAMGDEGAGADLVSGRARAIVGEDRDHPLNDTELRKLHPDLGAWWIAHPGGRLIPEPEDVARAVAQVVRMHGRSGAPERLTTPTVRVRLDEGTAPVRVGMLAALIAVADACLVGRDWVYSGDAVREQEEERQFFQCQLRRKQEEGKLNAEEEDRLKLLNQQVQHILKHRVVVRCEPTTKRVLIVPREYGPTASVQTSTLDGGKRYGHRRLRQLVAREIREELRGAAAAMREAINANPLPRGVRVPRSASEYEQLALGKDGVGRAQAHRGTVGTAMTCGVAPARVQVPAVVAELTATHGFHWRDRHRIPVESLVVPINPERGFRPENVFLYLDPDSVYKVPDVVSESERDYLVDKFVAAAESRGQTIDDLPNYRMLSSAAWRVRRQVRGLGDDHQLIIQGQAVQYFDVVATNFSMDEPLAISEPPATLRERLHSAMSPYDALWAAGCPLAVNVMIVLKRSDHAIINVRGERLAENWTQYGPSLSGSIILDSGCYVDPEAMPRRVDLSRVVEQMLHKELGGLIHLTDLVCLGLAMGLNKGLPALLAYATTDVDESTALLSLQTSNRWETADLRFVPLDAEAIERFVDGQEPNDGVRRVPYLEIALALCLYHRLGPEAFEPPTH